MDRAAAGAAIQALFAGYRAAQPSDPLLLQALTDGKLYELYVLSVVVDELVQRGFGLNFVGTSLKFKGAPGMIKTSDPHFEVTAPGISGVTFRVFVDIEFDTLGRNTIGASDDSGRHEIDIVVTSAITGYPDHDEIALGVECKAVANFGKYLIKEALGVRRELSYFDDPPNESILSQHCSSTGWAVHATPASEFWLAYIDAKGNNYADSPGVFGIRLRHLEP